MTYKLTTYLNGRSNGEGEYDDLYDAIAAANDALHLVTYPVDVDEFEITTTNKGRTVLVAYGYDDDVALERVLADDTPTMEG